MGIALLLALVAGGRIAITEVMADPRGITGSHYPEDRNEFVELYNAGDTAIDLLDWTIDDGDAVDKIRAWTDSSILNPGSLRLGTTLLDPHCYAVILDPEYTDTMPLGGYVQPYHFGANALILTVGNTTIGDELQSNDPVTLAASAAYGFADTSTFGTPWDPNDSFPHDAGDGISWERIDLAGPDTVSNWVPCRDTAGCTPGAANSTTTFLDLAVTGITLADTSTRKPGDTLVADIKVTNAGFKQADTWSISVFLDRNGDARPDVGQFETRVAGHPLSRGRDTSLQVRLVCPSLTSDLCARLPNTDGDSTNNFARLTIMPGGAQRLFDLNRSSFSPNGDGFEDTLAVIYRVPAANGTLKVTVFDLGGRQVTTLFSGRPPNQNGVVYWNGLSSSGARAPIGIYAVWVEYSSSGTSRTEKLPVVLLRK